jgi:hypothetical protein
MAAKSEGSILSGDDQENRCALEAELTGTTAATTASHRTLARHNDRPRRALTSSTTRLRPNSCRNRPFRRSANPATHRDDSAFPERALAGAGVST